MEKIKALPQLDFVSAVKLAAGRLTDFKGRSRRSEFWWWMAVVLVVKVAVAFILPPQSMLVSLILDVLIMACALSVTARRLQDAGYHAIWVFLSFAFGIATSVFQMTDKMVDFTTEYSAMIEHYGFRIQEAQVDGLMEEYANTLMIFGALALAWAITSLVVVILCLLDSKPKTNKYGPSPKYIMEDEEPQIIEKTDL